MKYSKNHCETAMRWLVKHTMVHTVKLTHGILITILNYDKYQEPKNYKIYNETYKKHTRNIQAVDTKQECKNDKKKESKDKYLDFVFLTQEEHKRLTQEFGKTILKEMILELDNYIGAMPKQRNKYTDHNRVLRGWVKEKILGNKSKAEAAPKLPYYPTMNTEKPDGTEKYRDVSKLASGLKEL